MSTRKWVLSSIDKENINFIAKKYEISTFLAMLFDIKKLTIDEIENILNPDYSKLLNVDYIDINKAVIRIQKAIENFEKICICGDYDADGVTATSLLYMYLQNCGADVIYKIPDRHKDGYGLNNAIIDDIKNENVNLIITVDNGITAVDEIKYAKSFGIDTIITDHHNIPAVLPDAYAIIDFKRDNTNFKEFAGVGVVFKLIIALEGENVDLEILLENYSDLVLIGTVGDVVPLKDENRLLVKRGLYHIKNTDKLGIKALLEKSLKNKENINSKNIAFSLVPRINAAGRLSTTEKVVRLFTSEYEEESNLIAEELENENIKRKEIEKTILEEAEELLKKERSLINAPVLILSGENWHPGVIGIVAAKIVDKYGKPTIILSKDGNVARGSARSIEGFSIYDAINVCRDYLLKFGGHPMAAGFDVLKKDMEKLKSDIFKYAVNNKVPFSKLNIACKLNPSVLNLDLVDQIDILEPFGKDNEQPVFGLYGMILQKIIPVSRGKHLRLIFERDDNKITVMKFFTKEEEFFYKCGDIVDLAVYLSKSSYAGNESLAIYLEDIKFSDIDNEYILKQKRLYDLLNYDISLLSKNIDILKNTIPSREELSFVYRWLKSKKVIKCDIIITYYRLIKEINLQIDLCRFLIILDVFNELGLLDLNLVYEFYEIKMNDVKAKVDLNSSKIIGKIKNFILRLDGGC